MIDQKAYDVLLQSLKEFAELPEKTLQCLANMEANGQNPREVDYIRTDCRKMYKDYHKQWKRWEGVVRNGVPVLEPNARLKFIASWDQLEAKLKTNLERLRAYFHEQP